MLFRYFCPKETKGQYIYVGKFNGNVDYLHITHVSAHRYESGSLLFKIRIGSWALVDTV